MSAEFEVVWTQVARDDLLGIIDYLIERDSVDAADMVSHRILTAMEELSTMPERCRVVPELASEGIFRYRERLIGPHRAMFSIHGSQVVILSVIDGRRDLAELLVQRALRDG